MLVLLVFDLVAAIGVVFVTLLTAVVDTCAVAIKLVVVVIAGFEEYVVFVVELKQDLLMLEY